MILARECDQTIEVTMNRDSRTKGGLTGISLNKPAVQRWTMSHHHRADISRACVSMAGCECSPCMRKYLYEARMMKDEGRVSKILSTIVYMINPCAHCIHDQSMYVGEELIVLCVSGQIAPAGVR